VEAPPPLPPEPPPRPRREIPRLEFVVPEAGGADVDVEALLGADGATLEAQLERARAIARGFAADMAGLESLFEGGDVDAWRREAQEAARRDAAGMVPARKEPFTFTSPSTSFMEETAPQAVAVPAPEPVPVPVPAPAPVPVPAPAPTLRASAPRPALSELDAQVDDNTIDNELNFDLDVIEKRLQTPEPAPLPLPPAPAPAPAVLATAPRRSVPPPPPPPAFRGGPIGPAPQAATAPTRGASGSYDNPSVSSARATPPPPAPPPPVEDPTLDSPSTPPTADTPRAAEKKGFFSKLFKKQS